MPVFYRVVLPRFLGPENSPSSAKNATKLNPFEFIPLQTTRKENNWKTEVTLDRAVVTLVMERIKDLILVVYDDDLRARFCSAGRAENKLGSLSHPVYIQACHTHLIIHSYCTGDHFGRNKYLQSFIRAKFQQKFPILNFWRPNYFFNFSTPCI